MGTWMRGRSPTWICCLRERGAWRSRAPAAREWLRPQIARSLLGQRLSRRFTHHFEYRREDIPVEVHWVLQQHFSFALDYPRLWRESERSSFRGRRYRRLSAEYELVVHILSLLTDLQVGKLTLKSFVDMYRILERPEAPSSGGRSSLVAARSGSCPAPRTGWPCCSTCWTVPTAPRLTRALAQRRRTPASMPARTGRGAPQQSAGSLAEALGVAVVRNVARRRARRGGRSRSRSGWRCTARSAKPPMAWPDGVGDCRRIEAGVRGVIEARSERAMTAPLRWTRCQGRGRRRAYGRGRRAPWVHAAGEPASQPARKPGRLPGDARLALPPGPRRGRFPRPARWMRRSTSGGPARDSPDFRRAAAMPTDGSIARWESLPTGGQRAVHRPLRVVLLGGSPPLRIVVVVREPQPTANGPFETTSSRS